MIALLLPLIGPILEALLKLIFQRVAAKMGRLEGDVTPEHLERFFQGVLREIPPWNFVARRLVRAIASVAVARLGEINLARKEGWEELSPIRSSEAWEMARAINVSESDAHADSSDAL